MKKVFVARKHKNMKKIKIALLGVLVISSCIVTFNILLGTNFLEYMKDKNTHEDIFKYSTNQKNLLSFKLLDPSDMLKLGLNYYLDTKNPNSNIDEVKLVENHVNDTLPKVYIYNTHDEEAYDSSLLESYNIKYSVKIASYILSEYLKDLGIPSYVEKESMADYLSLNGLLYKNSYTASRFYLEKRLKEYPSIGAVIDLHRDSVGSSVTKATIDGVNYAKVLFVVGLDYDNYQSNLDFATAFNSKLDSRLSRGISKKTGNGVNGVYNQDVVNKALLIEVGGVDNTISEVDNTLKVIAKTLFDNFLGDINDGKEEKN